MSPMLPMGGGQEIFGPGGAQALGTGSPTGPMDGMAMNPGDPSAQMQMQPQQPTGGMDIAQVIQDAIAQQMQGLGQQQQQEQVQTLMQLLQEADQAVQQMMSAIAGGAQTLDGPGNLPSGQPMGQPMDQGAPMGAPGDYDLGSLMPQGA